MPERIAAGCDACPSSELRDPRVYPCVLPLCESRPPTDGRPVSASTVARAQVRFHLVNSPMRRLTTGCDLTDTSVRQSRSNQPDSTALCRVSLRDDRLDRAG